MRTSSSTVMTRLNLFFRKTLGSAGPVSPGRVGIVGASTAAAVFWGVPKLGAYLEKGWETPSNNLILGTTVISVCLVEGAFYIFGRDIDTLAEATHESLTELAQTYKDDQTRLDALARASGRSLAEINLLIEIIARSRKEDTVELKPEAKVAPEPKVAKATG